MRVTKSAIKPILVVEDNPRDLELTLAALRKCKLSNGIIVARDGEEALRMLSLRDPETGWPTQLPAVVLLELDLPKIDGLEVLERVKSNPAIRHVPIVMFTASCEDNDITLSYELGANAFVVKPMDFEALSEAICSLSAFWANLNQSPTSCFRGVAAPFR
ncbi:response regulator [Azospirillum formosense]|uniref:response regulator n=1 Tax=Azospirillum formosense TaxID=861533 RepID=UPI001FE4AD2E|nr:response regulator [Azospirillum formosense]